MRPFEKAELDEARVYVHPRYEWRLFLNSLEFLPLLFDKVFVFQPRPEYLGGVYSVNRYLQLSRAGLITPVLYDVFDWLDTSVVAGGNHVLIADWGTLTNVWHELDNALFKDQTFADAVKKLGRRFPALDKRGRWAHRTVERPVHEVTQPIVREYAFEVSRDVIVSQYLNAVPLVREDHLDLWKRAMEVIRRTSNRNNESLTANLNIFVPRERLPLNTLEQVRNSDAVLHLRQYLADLIHTDEQSHEPDPKIRVDRFSQEVDHVVKTNMQMRVLVRIARFFVGNRTGCVCSIYKTSYGGRALGELFEPPIKEGTKAFVLAGKLTNLPPGEGNSYRDFCKEAFDYLFVPPLAGVDVEVTGKQSNARMDLVMRVPYDVTSGFWKEIREAYDTIGIVIECKNWSGTLKRDQVLALMKYVKAKGLGRLMILTTRTGLDAGAQMEVKEIFQSHQLLILVLNDEMVLRMLKFKSWGRPPEDLLDSLIYEFKLSMI